MSEDRLKRYFVFLYSKKEEILIFFLLIIAYAPILLTTKIVSPDAKIILDNLASFSNLKEYLYALINFKTIDFQPLRDLTLFLDLFWFDSFHVNTFILTNILIWFSSVLVIGKIIRNDKNRFILIILFALYPLFSNTICWAMARKHLLSFLFTTLGTFESLKEEKKNPKIFLYYFLSIISQPINILWPAWYFCSQYFKIKKFNKKEFIFNISLLILMIVFIFINKSYYQESSAYHEYYNPKALDPLNLWGRLQAMGHYFFQIFMPYHLAFNYSLNTLQSILGLFSFCVFIALSIKFSKDKIETLLWGLFSLLPLCIVTTDPLLMSDTYLLSPALGFLLLFCTLKINPSFKINFKIFFSFLLIFFVLQIHNQIKTWSDNLNFSQANFNASPNCNSAFLLAQISYLETETLPTEVKDFINTNQCLKVDLRQSGRFSLNQYLTVLNYMFYYEKDLPFEERIKGLENLKKYHYLSYFFLAALSIEKNNFSDADKLIEDVISLSATDLNYTYEPIVSKVLLPYCQKNPHLKCSEFMRFFSQNKNQLFFE